MNLEDRGNTFLWKFGTCTSLQATIVESSLRPWYTYVGLHIIIISTSSYSFQGLGLRPVLISRCPSLSWMSHISSTSGVTFRGNLWNSWSIHLSKFLPTFFCSYQYLKLWNWHFFLGWYFLCKSNPVLFSL